MLISAPIVVLLKICLRCPDPHPTLQAAKKDRTMKGIPRRPLVSYVWWVVLTNPLNVLNRTKSTYDPLQVQLAIVYLCMTRSKPH